MNLPFPRTVIMSPAAGFASGLRQGMPPMSTFSCSIKFWLSLLESLNIAATMESRRSEATVKLHSAGTGIALSGISPIFAH